MNNQNNITDETCDENVMNAFWLLHSESGDLYIVPRKTDGFDGKGPDDEILESLYPLSDETLEDADEMAELGFEIVPNVVRRCDNGMYYYS